MKVVLQRVKHGSVKVFDQLSPGGDWSEKTAGEIDRGLVLLVGMKPGDGPEQIARLAKKIVELRIFEDESGRMNRSVIDANGSILVVSQFTLYGDTTKGRRPSFTGSMPELLSVSWNPAVLYSGSRSWIR